MLLNKLKNINPTSIYLMYFRTQNIKKKLTDQSFKKIYKS